MINPFSLITTLRERVLFCIMLLLIGLALGWHLHSVWDAYMDSGNIHRQLEAAKEVPAKIIKFNQAMRKTNANKDACANQPIPSDVLDLLRH